MTSQTIIDLVRTFPEDGDEDQLLEDIKNILVSYAPETLVDLRKRILYLAGLQFTDILTGDKATAADLNAVMKWIDKTDAATPTEEDGFVKAMNEARDNIAKRGKLPDIDMEEDDPATR